MGDFEIAEQSDREVIARGESGAYPRVRVFLGDALARKGDIDAAAIEYMEYLRIEPRPALADVVRRRLKPAPIESLTRGGASD